MRHVIFTRMNFEEDGLFEYYLELMKRWYVPSVESQVDQDFGLAIIANKRHHGCLGLLLGKRAEFFVSMGSASRYAFSKSVSIQTRHDCDDWMHEGYTKRIKELYPVGSDGTLVVNSILYKFDVLRGDLRRRFIPYEDDGFVTSFVSLCQSRVVSFVYERHHRDLGCLGKVVCIDGYTMQVVHGRNSYANVDPRTTVICPGRYPSPV